MTSKLLIPLFCLLLATSVIAKLQVNNFAEMDPSFAQKQLKDIPYSIANFGFVPFGKTIIAQLHLSPGLDNECSKIIMYSIDNRENSFLLIPRGECPFVTKAIHAQQIGAKMAIIMDNEEHQRRIIMKDNGYGYKVKIPAIFINYKIGLTLTNLLNITNHKVGLKIQFENIKTQKADIILYLQAMNRQSYYFIEQFQPFYNKIKSQINLQLAYDIINCSRCNADDCYFDGLYCSVNFQHGNSATGKMILDQQIRQQVMFNKHYAQWWSYMKCINNQCNKISEIQQCSARCLQSIGMKSSTLATEFNQTFIPTSSDNSVLKLHLDTLRNSGVQSFPSIAINGNRMRGSINAEFVFDDICNTLLNPPKSCLEYIITQNVIEVKSHPINWVVITILLVICGIIFIALFVLCRRKIKKRMTREMQGRVDDMVSKYIEFYSQRNNRK